MSPEEFSLEFDLLYNNISSNIAPGLTEYEKSVFLTKSQDELMKNYFNPKGNKYKEGFDDSTKRQIDFSKITISSTQKINKSLNSSATGKFDKRSTIVQFPNDVLFILNELVEVTRNRNSLTLNVIPLDFKEYSRLMSKPFKCPLKYQAWRLINVSSTNSVGKDTNAEIIAGPTDSINNYFIRYIKKPAPIITCDLEEGLTINNVSTKSSCELDSALHPEILQRAVELAKAAYLGDIRNTIELGRQSE